LRKMRGGPTKLARRSMSGSSPASTATTAVLDELERREG